MISVIVPVYNVELYLSYCIESILSQSYMDFELLLIDDGSTDSSSLICDKYAAEDSRIKVVHNDNQGVSYSRNVGLKLAKGEYIAFCDADDCYKKDFLFKMFDAMNCCNYDLVICNYSYLTGSVEHQVISGASGETDKNEVYRRIFIDNTIGGFVWNKLFRKELIEGLFFEEDMQICEDTFFVCKLLKKIEKIFYINEPLYLYRLREGSAISNMKNMFDYYGNLKYAIVFEKIILEKIVEYPNTNYVKAGECVLAIGCKCDYLNLEKNHDREIIKKLNKIIKHNFKYMITCNYYTAKKKMVYIGNALFNLRKFKKQKHFSDIS